MVIKTDIRGYSKLLSAPNAITEAESTNIFFHEKHMINVLLKFYQKKKPTCNTASELNS